jgi:hypothetical protein
MSRLVYCIEKSITKSFKRLIWDYIKGDYNIMKQNFWEFDWDALIKREPDIDKACINFTNVIACQMIRFFHCIFKHSIKEVPQTICKLYLLKYFVAWFLIRTTYIQQVGSINLHVFSC